MKKDTTDTKVLHEKVDRLQENLDLHIRDTDKEIGDISNLRMEVAANTEAIKELRRTIERQTERATNRFAQVIEPVITSADELKETIDKKKTIIIPEKKRHWWKFWRR